eukprot:GAHX01001849.1.p1 GENE.GAHX01001849.1~~GAHX01001849.1.p1  ORF type:complete len:203 (+),score=25.52 GAHX01001849.1:38-646(+)
MYPLSFLSALSFTQNVSKELEEDEEPIEQLPPLYEEIGLDIPHISTNLQYIISYRKQTDSKFLPDFIGASLFIIGYFILQGARLGAEVSNMYYLIVIELVGLYFIMNITTKLEEKEIEQNYTAGEIYSIYGYSTIFLTFGIFLRFFFYKQRILKLIIRGASLSLQTIAFWKGCEINEKKVEKKIWFCILVAMILFIFDESVG